MPTSQVFTEIPHEELKDKVREMLEQKLRLSHITCTKTPGGFEITYCFARDDDYSLTNLRLHISDDTEIESVSDLYAYSFVYENELKDLFGVKINNISLDFNGNFYRLALKTPYNPQKDEPAPELNLELHERAEEIAASVKTVEGQALSN